MPLLSRKKKRVLHDISDQGNRLMDEAVPPSPKKRMEEVPDETIVEESRALSQNDDHIVALSQTQTQTQIQTQTQTQPDPIVEAVVRPFEEFSEYEDLNGRPGHMISIRLINFMCHDNFFFEFSPRVNVIHGENGSGKSAILTAVMLIFGVRASTTNRADSLKDFIKKGTKLTKIELTICNYNRPESEARAYKPHLYGKTILIERIITINGPGTFKVLNGSTRKVISKSRADINAIAEHFRIKVDNPATVLTQDISKHFLNSKNPSDKYRFYMQATEIESILKNYSDAKDCAERQYEVFVQRRHILKTKEEEHNKIRQKYEILNKYEKNLASIDDLKLELEWAQINKKAGLVQKAEKSVEDRGFELQRLNKDKDTLEKKLDALKKELEEVNSLRCEYEEKSSQLKSVYENLNSESTITSNDLKNACRNFKVQQKRVQDMKSFLQQNQDDLRKAQGENDTNYQGDLDKIVQDIQKINVQIITMKEEICELKTPQELNEMSHKIEGLTREVDNRRGMGHALKRSIDEMQNSNGKSSPFGPEMDACLRMIESSKSHFHGPVYGPFAKYIKVNNREQAPIVEKLFRRYLNAFLVTNNHDFEVLSKIFRRAFQGKPFVPTIATRKSTDPIDVSRDLARYMHYLSAWELFTITEKDVANFLIDNSPVHQTLFIPNAKEAYNHASKMDPNTVNFREIVCSGGETLYLDPLRFYPAQEKDRYSKYLVENNQARLDHAKAKLQRVSEEIMSLDRERHELQRTLANDRKERDSKERFLRGLESEYRSLTKRKEYIEEKLFEIGTTDFDELKRKIEVIEENLVKEKEELEELKVKQDECKRLYEEHQVKVDVALKEYNDFIENNQVDQVLYKITQKISNIQKKIREHSVEISLCEEKKVEAEEKLEEMKKELADKKAQVLAINSQELKNVRTVEQVEKAISDYQAFLRVHKDIMNNSQQIREHYTKSYNDIERAKRSYQECVELHNTLACATVKRKRALDQVKWFTDRKVNYFFKKFLQEKGMRGKILVHERDVEDPENPGKLLHRAHTLEIISDPAANKGKTASNYDSKSLSGGERSFSTVSFIVALWNIASTPFRILDEVDVFMDQATRQISLEMLVSFATNKSCDQFLFLSPLTIPDLEPSPKVKIFQMPVVER